MDVIRYSAHMKKAADKILAKTNLVENLSEFGEVIIGGSYKYDLMWDPDIDITVVCNDPQKHSTDALKKLIALRSFQKYEYGDFVAFEKQERPKSYIVNLRLPFEEQNWEIEIWFFEKLPKNQTENVIESKLNTLNKKTILEMKKQRAELGIDKHQISSSQIYQEVLLNRVTHLE